jgi:hypothetical protein
MFARRDKSFEGRGGKRYFARRVDKDAVVRLVSFLRRVIVSDGKN